MKKTFSLVLCFLICTLCLTPAYAAGIQSGTNIQRPVFPESGDGVRLISVEYIPDDLSDKSIPKDIMEKLTGDEGKPTIKPFGTGIPSASSTFDLSKRQDSISVDTDTVYYSDYVYVNHGGAVTLHIWERSGVANRDEFLVKVYVRHWPGTGTTVGTLALERNYFEAKDLVVEGLGLKDKVYFTVSAQEAGTVKLSSVYNYIKAGVN